MKKVSVVIPTRDRPEYLQKSLQFLEAQDNKNFEVVILDNPSQESKDFECSKLRNYSFHIKYSRASRPMSMTENWNRWTHHVEGEYVCFMSDRFFLLPDAIRKIEAAIRTYDADLFNLHPMIYYPNLSGDCLEGPGYLLDNRSPRKATELYDPNEWLKELLQLHVGYLTMPPWLRSRGMVYGGVVRRRLMQNICEKFGNLFHGLSPDYSSMVFLLHFAKSAVTIMEPLILFPNCDVGNGKQCYQSYAVAVKFFEQTPSDIKKEIVANELVPGLRYGHSTLYSDIEICLNKLGGDLRQNWSNAFAWLLLEMEGIRLGAETYPTNKKAIECFDRYVSNLSEESKLDIINATKNAKTVREKINMERLQRIDRFEKINLRSLNDVISMY